MRLRYVQLGTGSPHEMTSLRIEIRRHVYNGPLWTPRDHVTWLRDLSLRAQRAPGGPRDRDQNEPVKLQLYSDTKAMAKSINKPILTYCNQSIPSSYKIPIVNAMVTLSPLKTKPCVSLKWITLDSTSSNLVENSS